MKIKQGSFFPPNESVSVNMFSGLVGLELEKIRTTLATLMFQDGPSEDLIMFDSNQMRTAEMSTMQTPLGDVSAVTYYGGAKSKVVDRNRHKESCARWENQDSALVALNGKDRSVNMGVIDGVGGSNNVLEATRLLTLTAMKRLGHLADLTSVVSYLQKDLIRFNEARNQYNPQLTRDINESDSEWEIRSIENYKKRSYCCAAFAKIQNGLCIPLNVGDCKILIFRGPACIFESKD